MEEDKTKLKEISKLKFRIKELEIQKSTKQKLWDYDRPWEEYVALTEKEDKEISELDRKLRLIRPYEVTDIPDYGEIMTLNQFKNICRNGGFIDSDGFGYYLEEDKVTDIVIYPSDVKHKSLRYELNRIIWFNK